MTERALELIDPEAEARRLRALHELELLDTPPEERFDRITRLLRRLFGVPMAYVNLIDHDRQWTKSAAGPQFGNFPRGESVCAQVVHCEGAIFVEDLTCDLRFATLRGLAHEPYVRFHAGIVRRDGTVEALGRRGLPLGLDVGERYEVGRRTLATGEFLIAFTDGLASDGRALELDEVGTMVHGSGSAGEAVDRLLAAGGTPREGDDATVLVARVSG